MEFSFGSGIGKRVRPGNLGAYLFSMMGKTHAAAGALFAVAFVPPTASALGMDLGPEEVVIAGAIGTVAGLLPDIDHPKSMIVAGVVPGAKFLGPLGTPIGWLLSLPPRLIGAGARTKLKHRGGTHSMAFLALWTILAAPLYAVCIAAGAFIVSTVLGVLAALLPAIPEWNIGSFLGWLFGALPRVMPLVMMSVFWGYLSHLVTDSMTNVPVPWPWPLSKKRYSILPAAFRIRTDSVTEKALVRPLIFLLLLLVCIWNIALPVLRGPEPSPRELRQEAAKEKIEKSRGGLGGETPVLE